MKNNGVQSFMRGSPLCAKSLEEFVSIILFSGFVVFVSFWQLSYAKHMPSGNSKSVYDFFLYAAVISSCALVVSLIGRKINHVVYLSLWLQGVCVSLWLDSFFRSIERNFPHPLLSVASFLFLGFYSVLLTKYYNHTALKKIITAHNKIKKVLSVGDYVKFPSLPRHDDKGFYDEEVKIEKIGFDYLVFFDKKTDYIVHVPIIDVHNSGEIKRKNKLFTFCPLE